MASVNKVILLGNLGADPDVRYTPDGGTAICTLSLATSRRYKNRDGQFTEETEWHRVVLFGRTAEIARDYLKKGRSVYVEGRLRTRKWTDQNGNDRWTTEVVCENMQLLGGRDGSGQGGPSGGYVPAGDGFESAPRPAAPRSPAAAPQPQTVLTDTYGSASVQLEGTQGTITLRRTPETAAWDTDYGIRLEQDRTYPILGIYNEYIDLCIGELGASFHPVVYLLTKDGVVEYVDVLHCLMFGSALVCQDPIYIANQGVALERSGKEVILRQEDGSVLELAPLTAEWNELELPSEVTGAFNDIANNQFDWMDVESGGYFQMGVQDNNVFYQGYADYLGVVPEGMVLGVSTSETADGMPGITFVAAMKYDLHTNTLSLTMIDGPNPFEEGATQLQMIRCPDTWPQRVPLTAD